MRPSIVRIIWRFSRPCLSTCHTPFRLVTNDGSHPCYRRLLPLRTDRRSISACQDPLLAHAVLLCVYIDSSVFSSTTACSTTACPCDGIFARVLLPRGKRYSAHASFSHVDLLSNASSLCCMHAKLNELFRIYIVLRESHSLTHTSITACAATMRYNKN